MKRNWLTMAPSAIFKELSTNFGEADWVGWDPQTVLHHIETPTDVEQDKILAVQAFAFNTKLATTDAVAFENVVNAFCNNHCVVDAHQPPELVEVAYAIREMLDLVAIVHPGAKVEFTGEIPCFVAALAKFRGWFILPNSLGFAQSLLNHLTGLHEGLPKYEEHVRLMTAAGAILEALGDDPKLEDIVSHLEKEDALTDFTRGIVGCTLYDPTK